MEQALALPELMEALGERVAPVAMAHERTLPVADNFAELFAEGGLVRGRTLACTGPAATSLALALVAPAVAAGSWLGIIDLPTIGLDAASEFGLPLERVVAISRETSRETSREPSRETSNGASHGNPEGDDETDEQWAKRWPDVMAAAIDGFDALLVSVPDAVRPTAVRRVATRVQQRGAVVIVLGNVGPVVCDGVLDTAPESWTGVGDGHGHLLQRTVVVQASGRRMPGRNRRELLLPA